MSLPHSISNSLNKCLQREEMKEGTRKDEDDKGVVVPFNSLVGSLSLQVYKTPLENTQIN
jgi:hypothetical protein